MAVTFQREIEEDAFPIVSDQHNTKNDVAYMIVNRDEMCTAYTDLTGRFPYRSSQGNQYIMVAYHYDANCIYGVALKHRKSQTITDAWKKIHNLFTKSGVAPNTYVMDNEISAEMLNAMQENKVDYQLVPPHTHRRNLAERAIQTYKNHFKAGLATADPDFPLSEWDRLLEQANITINLLRASRANPKLSAYTFLFGNFDFTATPLAPPGTKVVVHKKSDQRRTWELNGELGWYIGPSMHHYRCVKCYFPRSKAVRDCDTVTFFPKVVPFPEVSLTDFLKQSATDIITILTQPPAQNMPSLQAGDPVRNALLTLATQLQRVKPIPEEIRPEKNPPTAPPRVQPMKKQEVKQQALPRVQSKDENTSSNPSLARLQLHSKELKSVRFNAKNHHRYPLRSKNNTSPLRPSTRSMQGTNYKHLAAQQLLAQHIFQHCANHIYNTSGKKETIDTMLAGPHKEIWDKSLSNEWGRLAQGNNYGVKGTDTIDFIYQHEVPSNKKVTYATYVLDYRPLKAEPNRVRITVGGDKLEYLFDAGSPAANMMETKVLINSTISDAAKGARFITSDIKDFFWHLQCCITNI